MNKEVHSNVNQHVKVMPHHQRFFSHLNTEKPLVSLFNDSMFMYAYKSPENGEKS